MELDDRLLSEEVDKILVINNKRIKNRDILISLKKKLDFIDAYRKMKGNDSIDGYRFTLANKYWKDHEKRHEYPKEFAKEYNDYRSTQDKKEFPTLCDDVNYDILNR